MGPLVVPDACAIGSLRWCHLHPLDFLVVFGRTKDILRLKTEMRDVLQEATDSGKMQTMLDEFPGYSVWCGGVGLGGAPA